MKVLDSGTDERDYTLSQYLPQNISVDAAEYILPLPDKSIVMNQYRDPTCVGHACAMAKMITEYMLTNKWVGLSPYSIYGYYDNSGGGMSIRYGVELLYTWGCLPLSEFSYTGDNPELHAEYMRYRRKNPDCDSIAARHKIDSYAKIKNFDEAKQAIAHGMPVVGGVYANSNFGLVDNGVEPIYPKNATSGHALCFVGWKTIGEREYLIAINSHGEESGDKGKVYIPRGRKLHDMFCISDTITPIKRKCKCIEFVMGSSEFTADGEIKTFETAPYIKNGRTYLPVRFVAENLGASVEWNAETGTATIRSEEAIITISDRSNMLTINGEETQMDVCPEISNGRMMAPIRFIAQALNCAVDWNEKENKAVITAL